MNRLLPYALSVAIFAGQIAPIALLGGLVISQTACPESQTLASVTHRVVREIDAALPILQSNNVDTAILLRIRDLAARAETAFANSENAEGAQLVGQLIDVFETELVEQINRIPNATTRTVVLVGLYLVNSKLHDLSDQVAASAAKTGVRSNSRTASTIETFKAKKRWQCRDSVSGQYRKMDYCKANPATTTVETR